MPTKHQRPWSATRRIVLVLVALVALTGACSSSGSSSKGDTGTGTTTAGSDTTAASSTGSGFSPDAYADLTASIEGSGSTFQQNYLNAAIDTLSQVLPDIDISYAGGGSGQGKSDLADGVVDFAGTDSLIKPEDESKYDSKVLYFPTVVAPITVSFHLGDTKDLKLDGPTIAGIFSTTIKTWDDKAIADLNPGVTLPSTPITVCHRSDASGTTTNFSKFLDSAGGDAWKLGSSDSLDWPAGTKGASGNGGVAQCIDQADGAIGYVDLSDAKSQKLTFAAVKNAAGSFVQPTLEGASAAADAADVADDLTYSPIDTKGEAAYPITSPTWIIVKSKQSDHDKGTALKGFLEFLLTDGQDSSFTASINYAPLPKDLAEKARAQIDDIEIP